MRRRKLLVKIAGLAVVAVGAFVLRPGENRITQANFNRIQSGTSWSEVCELIGPPGDYRSGPTEPCFGPIECSIWSHRVDWLTDYGDYSVWVTTDGRPEVESTRFAPHEGPASRPIGNLLWRTKRQWHRWFPEK
jgi:hypothetical protein